MPFQINGNIVITDDRLVQLTTGNTSSRPGSPTVGMLFFNTDINKVEVYDGAAWRTALSAVAPAEIPSAWAWGENVSGQLGDNTTVSKSSPVSVVGGFTDWVQIIASGRHTLALRANGTAWAWGSNNYGQLGDNTTVSKSSPVSIVGGFTDWTQISGISFTTSVANSAAVRSNGTIWCWGRNSYGQLGDNTTVGKSSPVSVVGGFTDWIQISASSRHTVALRATGTVWTWGRAAFGVLGTNNDVFNRSSPVNIVGGFTDWKTISTTRAASFAIRTNGSLWSWGRNYSGGLGDGTVDNKSSPVSVVGGFTDWTQLSVNSPGYHVLALRANGTAWAWGPGTAGKLGDNTTVSKSSPVSVVGGFTDWVQISAGNDDSAGIRANGTAWAWGFNGYGRLGDNTTVAKSSPVSVVGGFTDWVQINIGTYSTAAIRSQPRKS